MFDKRLQYQITASAPEGPFQKALNPLYVAINRVLTAFQELCGVGLIPGNKYTQYINNPEETLFPQNGRRLIVKAGENLSYGTPVSLSISGLDITAMKAIAAADPDILPCHAVVTGPDTTTGELVEVSVGAALIETSGLTAGSYYWLSRDTAGTLISTRPTDGIVQLIGFAISTSALYFCPEECAEVAAGGGGGGGDSIPSGVSIYGTSSTAPSGYTLAPEAPEILSITATTGLTYAACDAASCKLADGRVVLVGCANSGGSATADYYVGTYNSAAGTVSWYRGTTLPASRARGAACTLPDGRVVFSGGYSGSSDYSSVYIGTPDAYGGITWITSTAMPAGKSSHAMYVMDDGRLFVYSGSTTATYIGTVSGDSITWVSSGTVSLGNRMALTYQFPNGKFMEAGGTGSGRSESYTGSYSIAVSGDSASRTTIGRLHAPLADACCIGIGGNTILAIGGVGGEWTSNTTFEQRPAGIFRIGYTEYASSVSYQSTLDPIPLPRQLYGTSAEQLSDGKILLIGGYSALWASSTSACWLITLRYRYIKA